MNRRQRRKFEKQRRTDEAGPGNYFEQRRDRGELAAMRRTDEGFLIVEGHVAKPGILTYQGPNGPIRELVLAENLHRASDLETLMRKPVTLRHPRKDVSPSTVRKERVGSVGESYTIEDDGRVKLSFTIERSDAIKAVEDGKRQLSLGYKVEISPVSGIHAEFGRYDAIQVGRRYNHLAIVDRGRVGPSARFRTDQQSNSPDYPIEGPMAKWLTLLLAAGMERADAESVAAQCELESQSRVDSATSEVQIKLDTADGELTALKDAETARKDAEDDEPEAEDLSTRLDWFDDRSGLLDLAGKHGIEGDALKVENDALRMAVFSKLNKDAADDVSPEYVKAYLSIHQDSAPAKKPADSMYKKGRKDAFDKPKDRKTRANQTYLDNVADAREKRLALPVVTRGV